MARLPVPGGDQNNWGAILNDFLNQAHNSDGSLKAGAVAPTQLQDGSVTQAKLSATGGTTGQVLATDGTNLTWSTPSSAGSVPDASSSTKGVVQLAGDLGGTAAAPTVPGLASKEDTISAGTTAQYYRGDKTWQTLNKATVGLANVDNTTDVNKPISAAMQAALNTKADSASVPAQFNPTAGTNVSLTGTYPNITIHATPGAGVTDLSASRDGTSVTVISSTGLDATIPSADTSSAGVLSAADKTKLDGIAAGAQVNTVTSVAGKAGVVTLVKSDVGLANVDNTADSAKVFSGSQITSGTVGTARLGAGTADATTYLRGDGTWTTPAAGSSGTVTSVSVTSANGVSGTVSTPTSTPAISLTLGAITPTSVAATGAVSGSNLSGTNTGDQTITLTGDVSGSGTGSFAATIGANTVTNAKAAQMPAGTLKGNNTGATANATDLTAAQVKTLLGIQQSDVSGLSTALTGKADDSTVVHLAGTETISGTKTFSAAPRISAISDTNGATIASLTPTASAVNYIDMKNNSAGNSPTIAAVGSDTSIDINLVTKGAGARARVSGMPILTTNSSDTVINKSMSGSSNTFTNIPLGTAVTGNLAVTNLNAGTNATALTYWRGDGAWIDPPGVDLYIPFSVSGAVYVTAGQHRTYVESSRTITRVRASVGTAPTGASLIVDVLKNGTSIYATTPANRPTIAAGAFTALGGTPDTTTFVSGDYITISVLQIGSTVSGSDLTVAVRLQ